MWPKILAGQSKQTTAVCVKQVLISLNGFWLNAWATTMTSTWIYFTRKRYSAYMDLSTYSYSRPTILTWYYSTRNLEIQVHIIMIVSRDVIMVMIWMAKYRISDSLPAKGLHRNLCFHRIGAKILYSLCVIYWNYDSFTVAWLDHETYDFLKIMSAIWSWDLRGFILQWMISKEYENGEILQHTCW